LGVMASYAPHHTQISGIFPFTFEG
jgi:hypothetical protein